MILMDAAANVEIGHSIPILKMLNEIIQECQQLTVQQRLSQKDFLFQELI